MTFFKSSGRAVARGGLAVAAVVAGFVAAASPALAHGERAQEPFLRMRTVQFYDTAWSATKVKVNDEVIITGKMHMFEDWPVEVVAPPNLAFINVAAGGATFVRKSIEINGVNGARSNRLQLGGDYEYKVVLRARIPGKHHVHTMINVHTAGPIAGPGQYVTVEGRSADFINPIRTLTGETIPDLDTYGIANVVTWHLVWVAILGVWLYWWLSRPLFIVRRKWVAEGAEDKLVSQGDRVMAAVLLITTLVLVTGTYYYAEAKYPVTIPLQTGPLEVEPMIVPRPVDVKVERATYEIPGRTVYMNLKITNRLDKPVQVGEFNSANVRFINPGVGKVEKGYPREMMADAGLKVEPAGPINPGETKTLKITAADAAWETEGLANLISDPDSRFGGLMFFYDSAGGRHQTSIGGPLLPVFK
jgi:methane/ammonia monooxygenase subunit B